MQLGHFIDVFLARHVSGTYAYHQEHQMLSCSIWFSVPSFWMGGGLESRSVDRVYIADGTLRRPSHGTLRINKITQLHQVGISLYFLIEYITGVCSHNLLGKLICHRIRNTKSLQSYVNAFLYKFYQCSMSLLHKCQSCSTKKCFMPSKRLQEVCHPCCVCETRKRYVVKHNLITEVYLMTM